MKLVRAVAVLSLGLLSAGPLSSSRVEAAPPVQLNATLDCQIDVSYIWPGGQWLPYEPGTPIPADSFIVIRYAITNLGPADASIVTNNWGLEWHPNRTVYTWADEEFVAHLVVGEVWKETVVLADHSTHSEGTFVATLDADITDQYFGTLAGFPAPSESCAVAIDIVD